MKVYRITKCRFIDDLSGKGAALYGGRWNSKGTYIVYTAATSSLALLESVVHISNIATRGYCMLTLELPENSIQQISEKNLPFNWQQHPPPAALKKIGDSFIKENKNLAIQLPSAIVPEEVNYLLNPSHPDFKKIKFVGRRAILFDDRLKKK